VISLQHRQSNPLEHALEILEDFIIPESQDPKTLGLEPSIPNFVVFAARMMVSVGFNYYFVLETNKIDDVMPKRLLSFDFYAKIVSSQVFPQYFFGRRHFGSHLFCSRKQKVHGLFLAHAARELCAFTPPLPDPLPPAEREKCFR
jgi:hypothetical protein